MISQLLAPSLDSKLAEGRSPESSLLLAAHAQVIVSPVKRWALAHCWVDLLQHARTPSEALNNRRVPINRDSILSNEPEIRALLDLLVAPTPGHVRGIAMLNRMLSDGAGPIYNRQCPEALRGALLQATALLGSSAI